MPLAYLPSPSRSAWHLGPVPVRGEALLAVAGILLALWIAERRYRAAGGSSGVILDVAAWAIPAGLIPAAAGAFLAPLHGGPWPAVRTWDAVIGYPGAAALGTLAAWLACKRMHRGPRGQRVRLGPVAGAVAPAMAFGHAIADLGSWVAQQGYGHPSSLWWAVAISPAHRLAGYENFATFQPLFLYEALWDVTTGIAVIYAVKRFALAGERAFALQAAAYAAGGAGLFWLSIGHLPVILGVRAGELGDAAVLVGAAVYLVRTRRRRTASFQQPQRPALESDSPVM